MKVKHSIILILAVSVFGMALTYWYMNSRSWAVAPVAAMETTHAVQLAITTAQPAKRLFTLRTSWIGTVEPRAAVEVVTLVAGRIEAIEVEDQAWIEAGKLVARLGGPQVEGVRAHFAAKIESLKSQLDLAQQTVVRFKASLKAQLATKDQVAAAQDSHVKLQAQLRECQLNLGSFEEQVCIIAPMGGAFVSRRVSVGQDVGAGQVVGKIIDSGHVRIVASLFPPPGLALQGKEATVRLGQNQTLTGTVRSVLPQAGSTGAVMVWIESAQIDKQLHPGQTVSGGMVIEERPETLAVPESAIIYDAEERPYLFIQKDDTYEPQSVQAGQIQDGWVEVLSGLKEDQVVVTHGAYELFYRQFNEQFKVRD